MKNHHFILCILLLNATMVFHSCSGRSNETKFPPTDTIVKNEGRSDTSTNRQTIDWIADSNLRYIFLTWDDAPQLPGTRNCREVFKELGVKASFFATGFNLLDTARINLIDSMQHEYPHFLVANHGFSHAMNNNYQQFYAPGSIDSAVRDFLHNEQLLQIPVKIIRLPGHNSWAVNGMISGQLQKKPILYRLDSLGYQVIGWDAEWRGSRKSHLPRESATVMAQKVLAQMEAGRTRVPGALVLLSHDRFFSHPDAVDSLRTFIRILQSDPRHHFETIDRYPAIHRLRRMGGKSNSEN